MPDLIEHFRPALQPPYLTDGLPGIGGTIKSQPEDFEVEEVPAYLPSGNGDFLYLWIEKRDMGAAYFERQVAQRLGIAPREVGTAGLKDRDAVTRQWVSVPLAAEARLPQLEGDGIRVLQVGRHSNKLRLGHLHGNRFRILVRDCARDDSNAALELLRQKGVANFYGPQRFGRDSETLLVGVELLRGEKTRKTRNPFLRKLALSSVQSALFNLYLARRLGDGLLHRVMEGDVMCKVPRGGMFVAQDVVAEQARFEAREIVTAGPIFGTKTFAAAGQAREREQRALHEAGLSEQSFAGFGKLMQGTRRHNLVYLDDLSCAWEAEGLRVTFFLPAGSYATIVLREIMKSGAAEQAEESAQSE